MPNDDFVKKSLASAKGALASADRFQRSAGGPIPRVKPSTPKAAPAPAPAKQDEAANLSSELGAKAANVKQYVDAQKMDSYKKGGTVKKTGPAILHKGEEVIPVEKADKVKNMIKNAEGALSKEEKARGKAKHGKPKHTHVEHHGDGSHTVRHTFHPEMGADNMSKSPEEVSYAAKDMDELHDGLEQHLGEPNDGEEQAEAAPAAPAAGADGAQAA